MEFVTSSDGTQIATHTVGEGPPVVIVNGALSTAADAEELAHALVGAGLQAVTYDRRARGNSGDTRPADPHREVEDLEAVVESVDREVAVIGHSSGAVLALFAAGVGVPIGHLFLSEPPFGFEQDVAEPVQAKRIQRLVDEGRLGDAVVMFQRDVVGLPEEFVEQFKATPEFEQITQLAQSTVYDTLLTHRTSTPTPAMMGVTVPVTILCGVETMPFLKQAAQRLANVMPESEFLHVPESVGHRIHPATTARIIAERLKDAL